MSWRVRPPVASLVALAVLVVFGCADDSDDQEFVTDLPTTAFAGTVGSDAYIGIFLEAAFDETPNGATVFVTDGVGIAERFDGFIEQGTTVLTSDDGDAELELEGGVEGMSGRFDPADGGATDFEAPPVEFPAGLYTGYGEIGGDDVQAGAVLLDDGSSRAALLRAGEILPGRVAPVTGGAGDGPPSGQQLDIVYGGGDTWRVRYKG